MLKHTSNGFILLISVMMISIELSNGDSTHSDQTAMTNGEYPTDPISEDRDDSPIVMSTESLNPDEKNNIFKNIAKKKRGKKKKRKFVPLTTEGISSGHTTPKSLIGTKSLAHILRRISFEPCTGKVTKSEIQKEFEKLRRRLDEASSEEDKKGSKKKTPKKNVKKKKKESSAS